jgi:hypothetical protein
MGQQARERVEKFFDWKVVMRAYEDLWTDLKERALKYEGPAGRKDDPFAFSWADLFDHYPSTKLSGEERLLLTAFGKEFLREQERPTMYSDVAPLLSSELLKVLARTLKSAPRRVDELRGRLRESGSALIDYHLHWLIKNHLIRIEGLEEEEKEKRDC